MSIGEDCKTVDAKVNSCSIKINFKEMVQKAL